MAENSSNVAVINRFKNLNKLQKDYPKEIHAEAHYDQTFAK